jgi:hypothetical protein
MGDQLKCAFLIVWIVISLIVCCILVAPFLMPHDMLLNMMPECEWQARYGVPCPLCGMTHSFFLISSGRFSEARAANQHSLFLYSTFFINSILFLSIVLKWMLTDSLKKLIKVQLVSNSRKKCASVSGIPCKHAHSVPATPLARARLRNRLQGLASPPLPAKPSESLPLTHCVGWFQSSFTQKTKLPCLTTVCSENPTPCSNEFIKLVR